MRNEERSARVIHSYDTVRHEVRCGASGETSSTKHAAAVTCAACRDLLNRAAAPAAAAPSIEPAAAHDD